MPGGEEGGQPGVRELPGLMGEPQPLHPGLGSENGRHTRIDRVGTGYVSVQIVAHRINSSARANSDWGIVSPSAFAVFRLMISSNVPG